MDLRLLKLKVFLKKLKLSFARFFLVIKKPLSSLESAEQADRKLVYSLASSKVPRREQLKHIFKLLNSKEKRVLKVAITILIISLGYLGFNFYQKNLILLPKSGGIYREGVAAYPQSINPLYAASRDIDSDLSRLIYSSLFNYNNEGLLKEDLVEAWQVSEDGKEYTIRLRQGVKWHNGNILNADDVVFTVNLIKNPDFRSPLRTSLNGINVEKIDDYGIRFVLAEPYADFFHLLTFGIMPKFAWESVIPEAAIISELNLKPIGSGPYKFDSLIKNKGGELKEYHLINNLDYYGKPAYIEKIVFKFYPSYNEVVRALNANEIEGASYVPEDLQGDLLAKHSLNFYYLQLPQINSIFFNQLKNTSLKDIRIRQALSLSLDKDALFKDILGDKVVKVDGPILAPEFINSETKGDSLDILKAEKLLEEAGFKRLIVKEGDINADDLSKELLAIKNYSQEKNIDSLGVWWLDGNNNILYLKFSVSDTADERLALSIKEDWQELGFRVFLEKIAAADLASRIKNYDFEVLLYGQAVGLDPDVAVFWHSSQIGGQGLNLAQYNNSEVDTLLSDARKKQNDDDRLMKYKDIQEKIKADRPVIFLYSPVYTYVQAKKLRGFAGSLISVPSDRFANVSDWYLRTKKRFSW